MSGFIDTWTKSKNKCKQVWAPRSICHGSTIHPLCMECSPMQRHQHTSMFCSQGTRLPTSHWSSKWPSYVRKLKWINHNPANTTFGEHVPIMAKTADSHANHQQHQLLQKTPRPQEQASKQKEIWDWRHSASAKASEIIFWKSNSSQTHLLCQRGTMQSAAMTQHFQHLWCPMASLHQRKRTRTRCSYQGKCLQNGKITQLRLHPSSCQRCGPSHCTTQTAIRVQPPWKTLVSTPTWKLQTSRTQQKIHIFLDWGHVAQQYQRW
jgi:hypothetical protein